MMPKGVEHYAQGVSPNLQCPVKIPMMPKGVEHKLGRELAAGRDTVKIPMMPKGVEHRPITPRVESPRA